MNLRDSTAFPSTRPASLLTGRLVVGKNSGFLDDESAWRQPANPAVLGGHFCGLTVNRFVDLSTDTREHCARPSADYYTVAVGLRASNVAAYANGRKVFDGLTEPGAVHLGAPFTTARGIFRSPTDALHVFVSNRLLADVQAEADADASAQSPQLRTVLFERDPVLESLLRALALSRSFDATIDQLYAESLCLAITTHLLRSYAERPVNCAIAVEGRLAPWRVKRVIDYIEANLAQPITLADLASVAGLSRMHFAAQFRRTTGLRPHECVLVRRITRARAMILDSDLQLFPIATAVGFESQAHFSRVFKRLTGKTPSAWRAENKR